MHTIIYIRFFFLYEEKVSSQSCNKQILINNKSESLQCLPFKSSDSSMSDIFVKKWIDYSDKYGIGYLLTNGIYGVYFNDSTNVSMAGNSSKFFYIDKKIPKKKNMVDMYDLSDYPSEIAKKVNLFQYFQSYLDQKENKNYEKIDESNLVYLRFWLKKSRSLMFILSTKIVQVLVFVKDEKLKFFYFLA